MEKTIAFSLDWLTCTMPIPPELWPREFLHGDTGEIREIRPAKPYNNAWSSDERSIYWHDDHPEFKLMMRADGQGLQETRKHRKWDDKKILSGYMGIMDDTTVTRLDFAIDLFDQEANPSDLLYAWQCDQLLTTAQTVGIVENQTREGSLGATVYIGSRSSERFIRCYDKGKQQHTNLDWVRIELECKGQRAQELAEMIVRSQVREAGLSMLGDVIEWSDVDWLNEVWTDFEAVPIGKIGRPETNTERWIRTVCLPAIRSAAQNGMAGIVEALRAILDEIDEQGVHGNG